MAKTIAELRAQSQASLNNLITEIEEANKPKYTPKEKDARFWAPTLDSTGRTEVIARFLPAVDGETFPYAKFWGYYFKGPNGWYIQNSRTSLGKGHKDPMAEYNAKIWKEGREDEARAQKRRTYYVSNILIIDDPGNPENNGKVFLFRYGPQIFDKLNAVMFPSEAEKKAGVQSQNPFDLFSGRNIILKVKKQGTYNQYSDSVVMANNSPVADNDDKIMAIYNKCMPLAEFTAPSNFSSYEDLQKRVMKVFGLTEWFDTNALPASKPSAPKANSASTQEAELDEQIAESGADEEFNVDAILAQIKDKSSDNVPF